MENKHDESTPGVESLVAGLEQLEIVLGEQARPGLAQVRQSLRDALAARARGDVPAAMLAVTTAMRALGRLADRVDPAEAVLMRALADNFGGALLRGDEAAARESAGIMMRRSGAVERKKS